MVYLNRSITGLVVCLIGMPLLAASSSREARQPGQKSANFPNSQIVEQAVADYLESLTERQENDLLSRADIAGLFELLEDIGWDVSDSREIEQLLLADTDWLVRTLRTSKGTRFMRDMSSFPGGYDRVDRMRQLPNGKKHLQGLINSPGGAELIEYLTTTKQGRQTGAQLSSRSPGPGKGDALNTPTNHIYTKADVFRQMKLSYAAEAERRLQATSVRPRRTTPAETPQPARHSPQPTPSPNESSPPSESSSAPGEE